MKNLHLIPTDNPSRLHLAYDKDYYLSGEFFIQLDTKNYKSFNIYITSDVQLKDGEYGLAKIGEIIKFHSGYDYRYYAKIILTTDSDLIKDGVQAIDDEFIDWFVNNSNCEEVEVKPLLSNNGRALFGYKIIIPTLEQKIKNIVSKQPSKFWEESDKRVKEIEAVEQGYNRIFDNRLDRVLKAGFTAGAKWQKEQYGLMEIELSHTKRLLASCEKALQDRDKQKERSYSEEEVGELVYNIIGQYGKHYDIMIDGEKINELFEQLKKIK